MAPSSMMQKSTIPSFDKAVVAPCKGRAGRVPRRRVVVASIEPFHQPSNAAVAAPHQQQQQHTRAARASVLPLVSSVVESSAQVATFESFAGRSAMVGFLFALVLESVTERSLFAAVTPDQAAQMAAAAAATLAGAAALAASGTLDGVNATAGAAAPSAAVAAKPESAAAAAGPRDWRKLGARVHEAVLSSLTAARRSAASVSQRAVDDAVDYVLASCLTPAAHPVFGGRGAGELAGELADAGSAVAAVVDSLLAGEDRPDLLQ